MKVAIVAFNNLRISPYVRTYADWLTMRGIEFDVIYLDRAGEKEELGDKTYPIPFNKKSHKLFNFLRFARATKKIIKKNKYDFLFVMPTFPAVLLSGFLKRKYKGRYLVDIRDRTHEGNRFYFKREKRAVQYSAMNVISSKGYKSFLPFGEYVFCPNISASQRVPQYDFQRREDGKITIAYVGCISRVSLYKRLIEKVLPDERFTLELYGSEVEEGSISEYVESLSSERIKFHGAYKPEEKGDIIKRVDMLINIYGIKNNPAMANKLYDSMFFKKPMLSEEDSLMYSECGGYSCPFDIDDEDALDKLYSWYMSLDKEGFDSFADGYLEKAYSELDEFYSLLEEKVGKTFEVKK